MQSDEIIHRGAFIEVKAIPFTIKDHKWQAKWEYVQRNNRPELRSIDMVCIIPTFKENSNEILVLTAMYRCSSEKIILSLPSGFVQDGDLVENSLDILYRKTGYLGKSEDVTILGTPTHSDPWKSNETIQYVKIKINQSLEENMGIRERDDSEMIKIETVPVHGLLESLFKLCQENDYLLDSRLYTLALGIEKKKCSNSNKIN
ncbi:unnamed protein product [Blepharisma stoltei]|uniref:Nudix hydrolase domain-containing protein n=1 Tax=Blepharisma stoltei TaxID=1481888 RepID=A0AAU9IWE3_9CILI|nr:unnamed protein product [Blepharisma stoltei]